jgi:hypothetical protein
MPTSEQQLAIAAVGAHNSPVTSISAMDCVIAR